MIKKVVLLTITLLTFVIYSEPLNIGITPQQKKPVVGIVFSSLGAAALTTGVVVLATHDWDTPSTIGNMIISTIGNGFLIGGGIMAGISIPIYIKHYRK